MQERYIKASDAVNALCKNAGDDATIAGFMALVDGIPTADVAPTAWISVKDRLPEHPPDTTDEKGRACFCTTNYVIVTNGKKVFTAYFEHQGRQPGYFWYRDSAHELTDITHWMPLPEPPKEKA